MKPNIIYFCIFHFVLFCSAVAAEPLYKVQIDPTMALADYANIQVDRQITPTVSAGVMLWHHDRESWSGGDDRTSVGVRLDWFDTGVFEQGWHSNAMVKVDLDKGDYARTRLKLTQSYQLERNQFFFNIGIGAQFVIEADTSEDTVYNNYQSWLLPAWEISIGRSF